MNFNSIFSFEKKLVFLINLFLVILMILTFLFDVNIAYFFYFNILITISIGYIYFKRSRKLSKTLILTNLFIFFYFLYPTVASFLSKLLGSQSYLFILFYTITLSYIFLFLSKHHNSFLGDLSKFNFKIGGITFLLGLTFGVLFYLIQEPVPSLFVEFVKNGTLFDFFKFIIISSFIIALAEQMIFSGFLFNSYKELTSKKEAFLQVGIIFVCFHLLRLEVLVNHYKDAFGEFSFLFITCYYLLLFLFMITALYLYSFKHKNDKGNFAYPVLLHFGADLGLFMFYMFPFIL